MAKRTELWKWKECTNPDCDLGEGHNHLPVKFKACGNCKRLLKTVYNWPLLTYVALTLMVVFLGSLAGGWCYQERETLHGKLQEVEVANQREVNQFRQEIAQLRASLDQLNREKKELEDRIAKLNDEGEIVRLNKENVRLNGVNEAKQQEISQLELQLDVTMKRNIQFRNTVDALSKEPFCELLKNHLSLIRCQQGQ